MRLIEQLAEQKIAEAVAKGELDDLPGQGQALCLDDDSLVPPELRMAYRVLKNAGYLPPQVNMRREIANVESLIAQALSEEERIVLSKRLNYLLTQFGALRAHSPLLCEAEYLAKLKAKAAGAPA